LKKVFAAWRDASWFRLPGVAKRYHVLDDNGEALCGLQGFLLSKDRLLAWRVNPVLRCQRNGCRQAWPEIKDDGSDS
jgi:hypothetical protein